jgi:hypothetical protein
MGCGSSVDIEMESQLQLHAVQRLGALIAMDSAPTTTTASASASASTRPTAHSIPPAPPSASLDVLSLGGPLLDLSDAALVKSLNDRSSEPEPLRAQRVFVTQPGKLDRFRSDDLLSSWCSLRVNTLPEYATANDLFCIQKKWVIHTRLARFLRQIKDAFEANAEMCERMKDRAEMEILALLVIARGFRIPPQGNGSAKAVKKVVDPMTGRNVYEALMQLFDRVATERQPYVAYACSLLGQCDDSDLIVAKLSEVSDRSGRCDSAVRQAFNILVSSSLQLSEHSRKSRKLQGPGAVGAVEAAAMAATGTATGTAAAEVTPPHPPPPAPLTSIAGALQRLHDCFEDYLDDHKEKAFNSAMVQPARLYFDLLGDGHNRDHVDIHGMNWYLALLHASLGVQVPLLPQYR